MRRVVAGALAVIAAVAIACGGKSADTATPTASSPAGDDEPDPVPTGPGLRVTVVPGEAEVVVDGESKGPASGLPEVMALESGIHQILIQAPGYQTWRAEVAIRDAVEAIKVTLERAED